jgi:uncharacterized protein YjcR
MLKLKVIGEEFYNEETEEFNSVNDFTLRLEHSLLALSKWESKHKKSFLSSNEKSLEETISYVEMMILNDDYPEGILNRLSNENLRAINDYIESSESATTFSNHLNSGKKNSEIITAELVYYWMVAFNIPFECENWHLNRLFTLIQICNIKNSNPKKMPRNELAARNHALNEQRKAALNTSG